MPQAAHLAWFKQTNQSGYIHNPMIYNIFRDLVLSMALLDKNENVKEIDKKMTINWTLSVIIFR